MEELDAQRRGLAEDMQDGEECLSLWPPPQALWVCSIVFGDTLHVLYMPRSSQVVFQTLSCSTQRSLNIRRMCG